jgi:hypothetical protein
MSNDIFDFAFSHHEKPSDLLGIHNGYSRNTTIRKDRYHMRLHTFMALSDMGVSLKEPRKYRNYLSLPNEAIFAILSGELSDGLIRASFGGTISKDGCEEIRRKMVGYIVSSLDENAQAIQQVDYNIEGMRINGSDWHTIPTEKAVLIPALVTKVWETPRYEKRFESALDDAGKDHWVNAERDNAILHV